MILRLGSVSLSSSPEVLTAVFQLTDPENSSTLAGQHALEFPEDGETRADEITQEQIVVPPLRSKKPREVVHPQILAPESLNQLAASVIADKDAVPPPRSKKRTDTFPEMSLQEISQSSIDQESINSLATEKVVPPPRTKKNVPPAEGRDKAEDAVHLDIAMEMLKKDSEESHSFITSPAKPETTFSSEGEQFTAEESFPVVKMRKTHRDPTSLPVPMPRVKKRLSGTFADETPPQSHSGTSPSDVPESSLVPVHGTEQPTAQEVVPTLIVKELIPPRRSKKSMPKQEVAQDSISQTITGVPLATELIPPRRVKKDRPLSVEMHEVGDTANEDVPKMDTQQSPSCPATLAEGELQDERKEEAAVEISVVIMRQAKEQPSDLPVPMPRVKKRLSASFREDTQILSSPPSSLASDTKTTPSSLWGSEQSSNQEEMSVSGASEGLPLSDSDVDPDVHLKGLETGSEGFVLTDMGVDVEASEKELDSTLRPQTKGDIALIASTEEKDDEEKESAMVLKADTVKEEMEFEGWEKVTMSAATSTLDEDR